MNEVVQKIMDSEIRADDFSASVSAVIDMALYRAKEQLLEPRSALALLKANGISISEGMLVVSSNHDSIKTMLAGTTWVCGWMNTLMTIPGAERVLHRFGDKVSRGVKFPIEHAVAGITR